MGINCWIAFSSLLLFLFNCSKRTETTEFSKIQLEGKVIPDSMYSKLLKYNSDNTVVSYQSIRLGFKNFSNFNQNYVCSAFVGKKDTLNILINNYNGYFGNGILIHVFDGNYQIKSIDPNLIKGIKFENYKLIKEELVLNKSAYKKGDSIFGKLYFECSIDSSKHKKMWGYFRDKIE